MTRLPYFIRPEFVFGLAAVQVAVAYLLAMDTAGEIYRVNIQYGGLILWLIALGSFLGGCQTLGLFFRSDVSPDFRKHVASIYSLSNFRIQICIYTALFLVVLSTTLIIIFYGGAPLIMVAVYGISQSDFNEMQADAAPGLFGFHALFIAFAETSVSLSMMRKLVCSQKLKFDFWIGVVIIILATLIDGKRQGMIMFLFMLMGCYIITKYAMGSRRVFGGIRSKIISASVFLLILLVFFVVTDNRLSVSGEQEYGYSAAYEPLRYICLPLVNIEYLYSNFNLWGDHLDFLKPLEYLIPAKLISDRGVMPYILPEPTSPLGVFSSAWLYWGGAFGVFLYMFLVGIVCSRVYRSCSNSPAAVIIYGFVVWHLFASHTYNHFLTLNYFPLQCLVAIFTCYVTSDSRE